MERRYINNPEAKRPIEQKKDEEICEALVQAGIPAKYAPIEGSKVAVEITTLAKRYMATVVRLDKGQKRLENNELHQLDEQRRYYHQMLCTKILGVPYERLSPTYKRAISNFAAYLTDRQDYVDTF